MSPSIQELIQDGNRQPLLKVLRRHPDPQFRIEAARVLSQLQDPDCVEALIRSLLDDTDPEVRTAANTALIQCLGTTDAALAIKAYGSVDGVLPYEADEFSDDIDTLEDSESFDDDENEDDSEPEPESEEIAISEISTEFLDFSIEEKPIRWDIEEIEPLILILNDDNHPDRQMKALRIIAANPSPAGIDALSTVALWSENILVKNAAYKALKKLYAEDTDRLLAEFRTAQSSIEDEEEDETIVEIEQPLSISSLSDHSQVRLGATIEPEGLNGRTVLFILMIIFAIAAFLIYWFMLR
jgi:HEAT repeat protein